MTWTLGYPKIRQIAKERLDGGPGSGPQPGMGGLSPKGSPVRERQEDLLKRATVMGGEMTSSDHMLLSSRDHESAMRDLVSSGHFSVSETGHGTERYTLTDKGKTAVDQLSEGPRVRQAEELSKTAKEESRIANSRSYQHEGTNRGPAHERAASAHREAASAHRAIGSKDKADFHEYEAKNHDMKARR